MRALPLVLLAACAATPPPDEFSGTGMLPYGSASHETAWQALCRVSAREAGSETLRADSATWVIRCGNRFSCHAPPGGVAWVSFNDMEWYMAFAARFHETLARLQQGKSGT